MGAPPDDPDAPMLARLAIERDVYFNRTRAVIADADWPEPSPFADVAPAFPHDTGTLAT